MSEGIVQQMREGKYEIMPDSLEKALRELYPVEKEEAMPVRSKTIYAYKGMRQLLIDLLEITTGDSKVQEKGLWRSLQFNVVMSKEDHAKFNEDVFKVQYATPSKDPDVILLANGISVKVESYD